MANNPPAAPPATIFNQRQFQREQHRVGNIPRKDIPPDELAARRRALSDQRAKDRKLRQDLGFYEKHRSGLKDDIKCHGSLDSGYGLTGCPKDAWLCSTKVDRAIRFREGNNTSRHCEVRVFVEGADVTPYLRDAVSWSIQGTGGMNTCSFTVNNVFDNFIVTPRNICAHAGGASNFLSAWRVRATGKESWNTNWTSSMSSTDEAAKLTIYHNKWQKVHPGNAALPNGSGIIYDAAIDEGGMWLYPLNPYSCIFNKHDCVRVFYRLPHTTGVGRELLRRGKKVYEGRQLWAPAFTGFIDGYDFTDDMVTGDRLVNVQCYDYRGLLKRMRVRATGVGTPSRRTTGGATNNAGSGVGVRSNEAAQALNVPVPTNVRGAEHKANVELIARLHMEWYRAEVDLYILNKCVTGGATGSPACSTSASSNVKPGCVRKAEAAAAKDIGPVYKAALASYSTLAKLVDKANTYDNAARKIKQVPDKAPPEFFIKRNTAPAQNVGPTDVIDQLVALAQGAEVQKIVTWAGKLYALNLALPPSTGTGSSVVTSLPGTAVFYLDPATGLAGGAWRTNRRRVIYQTVVGGGGSSATGGIAYVDVQGILKEISDDSTSPAADHVLQDDSTGALRKPELGSAEKEPKASGTSYRYYKTKGHVEVNVARTVAAASPTTHGTGQSLSFNPLCPTEGLHDYWKSLSTPVAAQFSASARVVVNKYITNRMSATDVANAVIDTPTNNSVYVNALLAAKIDARLRTHNGRDADINTQLADINMKLKLAYREGEAAKAEVSRVSRNTGNSRIQGQVRALHKIHGQLKFVRRTTPSTYTGAGSMADIIARTARFDGQNAGMYADLVRALKANAHPLSGMSFTTAVQYLTLTQLPTYYGYEASTSYQKTDPQVADARELGTPWKLQDWNKAVLFGVMRRPLTKREVNAMGREAVSDINPFSGVLSPLQPFVHILTPPSGTPPFTIIQTDIGANVGAQKTYTHYTRLSLLNQICEALDYQFFVSPAGDMIFEFPHYNAVPADFGTVFDGAYIVAKELVKSQITPETGPMHTGWVLQGLETDVQLENITGRSVPNNLFKRTAVVAPMLARRIGVSVRDIQLKVPGVGAALARSAAAQDSLLVYALFEIQREIGRSEKISFSMAFRPYQLPNRPVHLLHRQRMGLATTVSYSMPVPGGLCTTGVELGYVRWLYRDGTFRHTAGGTHLPINYDALFTGDLGASALGVRWGSTTATQARQRYLHKRESSLIQEAVARNVGLGRTGRDNTQWSCGPYIKDRVQEASLFYSDQISSAFFARSAAPAEPGAWVPSSGNYNDPVRTRARQLTADEAAATYNNAFVTSNAPPPPAPLTPSQAPAITPAGPSAATPAAAPVVQASTVAAATAAANTLAVLSGGIMGGPNMDSAGVWKKSSDSCTRRRVAQRFMKAATSPRDRGSVFSFIGTGFMVQDPSKSPSPATTPRYDVRNTFYNPYPYGALDGSEDKYREFNQWGFNRVYAQQFYTGQFSGRTRQSRWRGGRRRTSLRQYGNDSSRDVGMWHGGVDIIGRPKAPIHTPIALTNLRLLFHTGYTQYAASTYKKMRSRMLLPRTWVTPEHFRKKGTKDRVISPAIYGDRVKRQVKRRGRRVWRWVRPVIKPAVKEVTVDGYSLAKWMKLHGKGIKISGREIKSFSSTTAGMWITGRGRVKPPKNSPNTNASYGEIGCELQFNHIDQPAKADNGGYYGLNYTPSEEAATSIAAGKVLALIGTTGTRVHHLHLEMRVHAPRPSDAAGSRTWKETLRANEEFLRVSMAQRITGGNPTSAKMAPEWRDYFAEMRKRGRTAVTTVDQAVNYFLRRSCSYLSATDVKAKWIKTNPFFYFRPEQFIKFRNPKFAESFRKRNAVYYFRSDKRGNPPAGAICGATSAWERDKAQVTYNACAARAWTSHLSASRKGIRSRRDAQKACLVAFNEGKLEIERMLARRTDRDKPAMRLRAAVNASGSPRGTAGTGASGASASGAGGPPGG